jgi:hypothetical protein
MRFVSRYPGYLKTAQLDELRATDYSRLGPPQR